MVLTYVVDVNVPIASDGKFPATAICQSNCLEFLKTLKEKHKIALDSRDRIFSEYERHLSSKKVPSVSGEFFKWVSDNKTNLAKCEKVDIHPNRQRGFDEFPNDKALKRFHSDDRKYIAVAIAHGSNPEIAQAVDYEWRRYERVLNRHGVRILFLS